jgi:hypothetical protein
MGDNAVLRSGDAPRQGLGSASMQNPITSDCFFKSFFSTFLHRHSSFSSDYFQDLFLRDIVHTMPLRGTHCLDDTFWDEMIWRSSALC